MKIMRGGIRRFCRLVLRSADAAVYVGFAEPGTQSGMPPSTEDTQVVCVSCRTVYSFAAGAHGCGCPNCGGLSWVSARLVAEAPPPPRERAHV
jgi:LSD1 subclass zinc finger protein